MVSGDPSKNETSEKEIEEELDVQGVTSTTIGGRKFQRLYLAADLSESLKDAISEEAEQDTGDTDNSCNEISH